MAPPSKTHCRSYSANSTVKEEKSYHAEMRKQEASIDKLEKGDGNDDENAEFLLRQEVCYMCP